MKKKICLLLTALAVLFAACALLCACSEERGSFEASYAVRSGESVTITGSGITYRIADCPDGVSVDENEGVFTFFVTVDTQVLYLALQDGEVVDETVVTCLAERGTAEVAFTNPSQWIADGDYITAQSTAGTAVSYTLVSDAPGVSVNSATGRVTFTAAVTEGTQFTVRAAESGGAHAEETFSASVTSVATVESARQATEAAEPSAVQYTVVFAVGEEESIVEAGVYAVQFGNTMLAADTWSYDAQSRTLMLQPAAFADWGTGEYTLRLVTYRNTISVGLTLATKVIRTVDDLLAVQNDLAGIYVLANDIDLADYTQQQLTADANAEVWTPFGLYVDGGTSAPFTGVFEGNGYEIKNFYMNRSVNAAENFNAGFFGYIGANGEVRNLGIRATSVQTRSYSGGFVGQNEGTIENCYIVFERNIYVVGYYGGMFAGHNEASGHISNCYAAGNIASEAEETTGQYYQGAFIGFNTGTVENSYAALGDDTLNSPYFAGTRFAGTRPGTALVDCVNCTQFESIAALQAYDFTQAGDMWVVNEGAYPTLSHPIAFYND